jgi:hypothetical protein
MTRHRKSVTQMKWLAAAIAVAIAVTATTII